jgi:cytochrome c oxidase cbb3-type subunit 3
MPIRKSECAAAFRRCAIFALLSLSGLMAQTPAEPAGDASLGQPLFESQCALCHGQDGSGGRGPNLRRAKLNHAPDETALRKVISDGIQPEMPGAWQLDPHEVASVAAYVRKIGAAPAEPVAGDPAQGEHLYQAKGCASCHMILGTGSGYGPELTDIGSKRNAAYLRESIVTPDASVPENFMLVEAVTASGATVRGIRVNEDSFTIQIKDSKSAFHSYRKRDL